MGPLTPASRPVTKRCRCGGDQVINIILVPTGAVRYPGMFCRLNGTMMRAWRCPECYDTVDAGTRWPEPKIRPEVRPEIVTHIRNLRKAGWYLFEWEKPRA